MFYKEYIKKDQFDKIEKKDKLNTRFMGECIVTDVYPDIQELKVKFTNGAWKDRELNLIRQQIERIL